MKFYMLQKLYVFTMFMQYFPFMRILHFKTNKTFNL